MVAKSNLFDLRQESLARALHSQFVAKEALNQTCPKAPVAFENLLTHGSAIRSAFRSWLRSSSLREPRYPSLRFYLSWFEYVNVDVLMIHLQVHLQIPCYDFSFL